MALKRQKGPDHLYRRVEASNQMARPTLTPIVAGQQWGRLTTIAEVGRSPRRAILWECLCSCGKTTVTMATSLRSGNTKSCGCLQNERCRVTKNRTHGMIHTREYRSWASMRNRCANPKNPAYHLYGGRGITVCERWDSFESFYSDMGPRPEDCSLDRVDADGNYEPGNVRWATQKVQQNNRRSNVRITYRGETRTVTEWASVVGLPYSAVSQRFAKGWNTEKTLTTPLQTTKRSIPVR